MVWGLFKAGRQAKKRLTVGILRPYDRRKVEEEWEKIEQLIKVGKPSAIKEAVISADKLLDYVLTQISFGEALGERLKNARYAFPPLIYQGLWDAHKMRNSLVHDSDFDLTQLVAQEVLGKYKAGLKALGVGL